ncbi:hypothetical protein BDZ91DRAFT_727571 [Kalaharituber pfeilii]|nr:hypothetical protein BDZ91DRAFT_727571 [Kalaharituber pfeilii]
MAQSETNVPTRLLYTTVLHLKDRLYGSCRNLVFNSIASRRSRYLNTLFANCLLIWFDCFKQLITIVIKKSPKIPAVFLQVNVCYLMHCIRCIHFNVDSRMKSWIA